MKKRADVVAAVHAGITTFVFDSIGELAKFAGLEDRVELLLRVGYRTPAALIDLSYEFGADPGDAVNLLQAARRSGLRIRGLSFHPGSQLASPEPLREDVRHAAMLVDCAAALGIELDVLDIGGGLPVPYDTAVPHLEAFTAVIAEEMEPLVRRGVSVISEPGRFLAAPAVLAVASVVG